MMRDARRSIAEGADPTVVYGILILGHANGSLGFEHNLRKC